MKTLLFTGISVKNCMQLYAIEKPQITADKIRAFVSLSWEERTERSRPGLTKQRHVVRSRALSLLHLLSPWLPRTRPLGSKAAAEAPALVFMSHATGELKAKGHVSQLRDLPQAAFQEIHRTLPLSLTCHKATLSCQGNVFAADLSVPGEAGDSARQERGNRYWDG